MCCWFWFWVLWTGPGDDTRHHGAVTTRAAGCSDAAPSQGRGRCVRVWRIMWLVCDEPCIGGKALVDDAQQHVVATIPAACRSDRALRPEARTVRGSLCGWSGGDHPMIGHEAPGDGAWQRPEESERAGRCDRAPRYADVLGQAPPLAPPQVRPSAPCAFGPSTRRCPPTPALSSAAKGTPDIPRDPL